MIGINFINQAWLACSRPNTSNVFFSRYSVLRYQIRRFRLMFFHFIFPVFVRVEKKLHRILLLMKLLIERTLKNQNCMCFFFIYTAISV